MNTIILDTDIVKSGDMLDSRRLFSSIYEGIHGLASILDMEKELVNPIRNKKNHPCAMQYKDCPGYWLYVLFSYYWTWVYKNARKDTDPYNTVNWKNLQILMKKVKLCKESPDWVENIIPTHKANMLFKLPSHYSQFEEFDNVVKNSVRYYWVDNDFVIKK